MVNDNLHENSSLLIFKPDHSRLPKDYVALDYASNDMLYKLLYSDLAMQCYSSFAWSDSLHADAYQLDTISTPASLLYFIQALLLAKDAIVLR